jgi:DNA helicase-2/ATP-dependent DNA helicase PcrA
MDFATRYGKLDGPVMVIAGPGTGKTELLSMRAANILKKTDVLPENILCLTFTDSGATAMQQRLSQIIGPAAYKVAIHTFHSFGSEIINQNSQFFYHGAQFRPADELMTHELLREILEELPHSDPLAGKQNGEFTHQKDILTTISELKKSGLTSDELLGILDANSMAIETIEPVLSEIFANISTRPTRITTCEHSGTVAGARR